MSSNLVRSISTVVLPLNSATEEHGSIVDEIRRVLRQIQHHKIEIQSHHTFKKIKSCKKRNLTLKININEEEQKHKITFSYENSK